MIDDILAAMPLAFILSFIPGAVFFVLLETSVVKGFRAALVFDAGVILADMVFICIAYFSSYRLLEAIKDDPALFIFGGLILLTYGFISFIKQKKHVNSTIVDRNAREVVKNNYLGLFLKGFLLNFINVGVLGFWLTTIIAIGPQMDMQLSRMITFFASVLGGYFLIDIGKIALAKQLRNRLNSRNIVRMKKVISVILMAIGVLLLAQAFTSPGKVIENIESREYMK